jgi:hypothetical protein
LQEVKVRTMAQPAWYAAESVGNSGGNVAKVPEFKLLPKADECGKVKCLSEHITKVFRGVHMHCLDKLRFTEDLYPLLPGTASKWRSLLKLPE